MRNHRAEQKQHFDQLFGKPATLDELAQTVIRAVDHRFAKLGHRNRVVGFAWDMRYGNISTSHCAPICDESNFTNPTTHPGWSGRLWIRYAEPNQLSFGSDLLDGAFTYTGTGGFGSYNGPWEDVSMTQIFCNYYPQPQIYSWDYRFFASDWPELERNCEKQAIWSSLSNKPAPFTTHRFEWHDPLTHSRDQQFLQMIKDRELAEKVVA
jgi:hypothetical protein